MMKTDSTDDSAHGGKAPGKRMNFSGPFPFARPQKRASDEVAAKHVFSLPVDSEHKAKAINLFSFAAPHMRCFHLNWTAFFITFLSAYAAAPLIEIIRQDLNLTQYKANTAGVVTTAGTVVMRVAIGSLCDKFGPRYTYGILMMLVAMPIFGISTVQSASGYIVSRLFIGFGLAAFVCCQFWASIMFSPNVVGIANAVAGGWGNAGGGITQLVMPNLAHAIAKHKPLFEAWRLSFFLPGCLSLASGAAIMLFGQDTPDGDYAMLEKKGKKAKAKVFQELTAGILNYRVWLLGMVYAFSFGVELALDNVLPGYFGNQFGFSLTKAGNLAAIYGTLNFVSRPLGGVASDLAARRFGMRGRLWVLFIYQALAGVFTCLIGTAKNDSNATLAYMVLAGWFVEGTCGAVYGVVPFISRRSTGFACGVVSAGGAIGGVMNQGIFFLNTAVQGPYYIATYDSIKWLGVVMCVVAVVGVVPVDFPMWGGMFWPARKGVTEEDYYYAEYTAAEREKGLHLAASAFCVESRSMRGMKRLAADAASKFKPVETPSPSSSEDAKIPAATDDTAHGQSKGLAHDGQTRV
jgi:NNP family nitrate/nitrite transporter-like MFS transporter